MKHQPAKQDQTTIPGTLCPTLYDNCVGTLTAPADDMTLKDAGDRAYNLSPLSKRTRTSPAWQSGTLPTELTGCEMT